MGCTKENKSPDRVIELVQVICLCSLIRRGDDDGLGNVRLAPLMHPDAWYAKDPQLWQSGLPDYGLLEQEASSTPKIVRYVSLREESRRLDAYLTTDSLVRQCAKQRGSYALDTREIFSDARFDTRIVSKSHHVGMGQPGMKLPRPIEIRR